MLVILTTHPIQYQVPLWQALGDAGQVPFEVWYLTDHAVKPTHDREFGQAFAWDLGRNSLDGYRHRFLQVNAGWTLHPAAFRGVRLEQDLRPLFRDVGATVLWIQGWQKEAYWQAARQARAAGLKVWLRGESNDLAPTPWWKRAAKRVLLGRLFRKVDRFLCIGAGNRRLYRSLGVPEARLGSAPYFVDNARFARQAAALRPERAALRRAWGIPEDAFCVLFCGKFIPKKRPLDLVRAAEQWSAVTGGGRPLHLLFAGSGELGGALRAATAVGFDADAPEGASRPVAATGSGRIGATFTGFLNQTAISRAYVAADCLALPSDHGETWGLVVNEAMASGLPCVASDACGSAEDLVAAIDPRMRFPLGDPAALARALGAAAERDWSGAVTQLIAAYGLEVTRANVTAEWQAVAPPAGRLPARR